MDVCVFTFSKEIVGNIVGLVVHFDDIPFLLLRYKQIGIVFQADVVVRMFKRFASIIHKQRNLFVEPGIDERGAVIPYKLFGYILFFRFPVRRFPSEASKLANEL